MYHTRPFPLDCSQPFRFLFETEVPLYVKILRYYTKPSKLQHSFKDQCLNLERIQKELNGRSEASDRRYMGSVIPYANMKSLTERDEKVA